MMNVNAINSMIYLKKVKVDNDQEMTQSDHQENMSVKRLPPKPHFNVEKTGVCRGIHIILIFAAKHRLWVLVSRRGGSNVYPQSMFKAKNKKNIKIFQLKIFNF